MDIGIGRRSVSAQIDAADVPDSKETALAAPAHDEPVAPFHLAEQKYTLVAPIGGGGMGEVHLVHDKDLRRDVAMKMLRAELSSSASLKRKFVAEAQATSQLEHPGIPPVHDIGVTPDGKIYFTMKVVRGSTLSTVLRDVLLGVKDARREYTLHKLVSILEQIAEAVHFAHEKGVLHRDLKPENVMLGEYGEVHVMDWGLAKVGTATDEESGAGNVSTAQTESGRQTRFGAVQGTVPYMSPEQAMGQPLDRRSDIYALGAILYEILTLRQAFEGHGDDLLRRVRQGEFPAVETRNLQRPVPEALASLTRRAMTADPSARPATARAFADELRAFLDGRAEKERRHREAEAEALAAQGKDAMAAYVVAQRAIDTSERVLAENGAKFRTWQSVEEKAPFLDAREALDAAKKKSVLAFAETTRLLEGALLAEPRNASALATLADLWRGRLDDAERRGDGSDADFALTMAGRYDDGRLAAWIAGDGTLELTSDPPGAEVVLHRFEDRHGVMRLGEPHSLGRTPLASRPLPMGSYLCVLASPNFRDVRYPVHVTRNRAWKGRVTMRRDEEIGDGFVYVPAGPFVYGEESDARSLDLADFAIARSPVTFADWAEFLAAVEAEEGAEAATKLCPGTPGDGAIMERAPDGAWRMKPGGTSGPAEAALLARHGVGFESRCPVMAISWFDAFAYCEWKTRATGRQWRLPTEEEREKAGRGVDGRRFPWGDLEDASLAKCRESREEPAQPEPVGSFPAATSVFGLLDAAGGTFDWTDSWFDPRRASRAARGGAWSTPAVNIRCAYRSYNEPSIRRGGVGLRCARGF